MACAADRMKVVRMWETTEERKGAAGRGVSRLESVFLRHAARVYTLCQRLLVGEAEAEDATVQVFARFGREPSLWSSEARTTLARLRELAVDEALRRLRARRTEQVEGRAAERGSPPAAPAGPPPTENGGPVWSPAPLPAEAIDTLAGQLPDDLRAAFVLRDQEALSDRVVASHLRVGEPEARRLVHRARMELRRLGRERAKEGSEP